jgi:hypothetical protein
MSLDFIVEDPLACKRKRSSRACELCRLRKVRCDGLDPKCSRCWKENRECSYAMTKKRGPKSSNNKPNLPPDARTRQEFDLNGSEDGSHHNITQYRKEFCMIDFSNTKFSWLSASLAVWQTPIQFDMDFEFSSLFIARFNV